MPHSKQRWHISIKEEIMSEIIIRHAESEDIQGIQEIYTGEKAYSETLHVPYISKQAVVARMENLPNGVYLMFRSGFRNTFSYNFHLNNQ